MRFGRWSVPQPATTQNVAGSTVEATQTSKKSAETKNGDSQNVVHRKGRSRYDIPEPRQRLTTKSSDKPSLIDENVAVDYPIIDRIPTAIGYLSDESDEEWLEEKSRCSRYDVSEHADFDDDIEITEADEEENRDDDDFGDDGDDKYSQNGAKTKRESIHNRDTISALWSQSTDSETDKHDWQTRDAGLDRDKKAYNENISYAEEKGTDPIYDKNQGKARKQKSAKGPNSPAEVSNTSSMSDNLQKMLHFAPTNDEAVASIEGNIQILKATAAEEYGTTIQNRAKPTRKSRRAIKAKKVSQRRSKTAMKDQIELSRSVSMNPAKSKDDIELSRTVSLPDSVKPTLAETLKGKNMPEKSNDVSIVVPANSAPAADDFTDAESTKSGRQSRAMYTKSLLTEDSDNDDTLQLVSSLPDHLKSQDTKNASTDEHSINEKSTARKHRIGILLSNSWNFAGTARMKAGRERKEKIERKPSIGFFSKLKKQRKEKLEKHDSSSVGNLVLTETSLPTGLVSPRSKGSTEPKELDEYSRSTKDANSNEPDVVQCLRYFQCGSVANNVNVAISVANCGAANENGVVEEEDDMNDILDATPTTPKTTVEVYLNDDQQTSETSKRKSIVSCGNSMSCKNDSPEDDDFTEVPGLGLSRAASIIIDVTGMQLHLDGDSEMDRKLSSVRGIGGSQSRSDISVTSITVPVLTSTQSESNEERAEETELELKDYMEKINKRKGIRGFFRKFSKKTMK